MIMNKNSRIGIWGYGIVGKAIARYARAQGYSVGVMDKRTLTIEEVQDLTDKNIIFYPESNKNNFFYSHDHIFSSPGVNIGIDYPTHKQKWLTELDLFADIVQKPIVAVTGSIGKTSVTHMLASLFKLANIPSCVGGNIGIATFDLLPQKDTINYALLEVSSAQLQHCTTFAPHLAIWTNFHPNHLDFHATYEEYFLAKYNSMAYQKSHQHALIHLSLRSRIPTFGEQHYSYFTQHKPTNEVLAGLHDKERIYYVFNNVIMCYYHTKETPILALNNSLMNFSFIENSIILAAAAHILSIDPQLVLQVPNVTKLPEHRLEKIATINDIDFYNDSKSTTIASTLAAVEKLKTRPLHLFLGGLSKGVDREPLIAQLMPYVKHIYCFGKEAEPLYAFCTKYGIQACHSATLEEAFNKCIHYIHPGDMVLLSPAGSSFDLYTNFEARGKHFKELVNDFKKTVSLF